MPPLDPHDRPQSAGARLNISAPVSLSRATEYFAVSKN
jgi:hypothetical protein